MRRFSAFLPRNPDVLGLLLDQAGITIGGLAAFVDWAAGEPGADQAVRDAEHEADERKRILRAALRAAFITPIGAEDIFVMSSRLDAVLNGAKDAVREAEVLELDPDSAVLAMAQALAEGGGHLADAFAALRAGGDGDVDAATLAAERAHQAVRTLERLYRNAMQALNADEPDVRRLIARRDLYRRFIRMSADVIEVAERVWYVAVKEG